MQPLNDHALILNKEGVAENSPNGTLVFQTPTAIIVVYVLTVFILKGIRVMKPRKVFPILLSLFLLTSLACGLLNSTVKKTVLQDKNMTAVASLWSDVPPMDGMTTSEQIEMPIWLKAITGPIMDNMMKGLNNGEDTGHWDWTAFNLGDKSPADVQAFYTPERMSAFSWQQADSACIPMNDQGVLCSFTKEETGKTTGLIIIAATDEQKKETSVFFLRAEGVPGTATPPN
jgi:hypothetical protein